MEHLTLRLKVTEEYRHFKDAEELNRTEEMVDCENRRVGKAPFRQQIFRQGSELQGTHSYKVFFEEYINADTSEPAGGEAMKQALLKFYAFIRR